MPRVDGTFGLCFLLTVLCCFDDYKRYGGVVLMALRRSAGLKQAAASWLGR